MKASPLALCALLLALATPGFAIKCYNCAKCDTVKEDMVLDCDTINSEPGTRSFENILSQLRNDSITDDLPQSRIGFKFTQCAKAVQKVGNETIVIRGCAEEELVKGCKDFNEMPGISCSLCDKDFCNLAPVASISSGLALALAALTLLRL